jgi:Tetracyclin repressor-like, C-terminal domain
LTVAQALAEAGCVTESLSELLPLTDPQAGDVVATATGMAGALWRIAAPGTPVRELYEEDHALSHAIIDVGPRLASILAGLLTALTRRG